MASKIISLSNDQSYEVKDGEVIEKVISTSSTNGVLTVFSKVLFVNSNGDFVLDVDGEGVALSGFTSVHIEGPFYKVTTNSGAKALLYIK